MIISDSLSYGSVPPSDIAHEMDSLTPLSDYLTRIGTEFFQLVIVVNRPVKSNLGTAVQALTRRLARHYCTEPHR